MNRMDGLTALQRKVAARPPLVPAVPSLHPRALPAPSPATGLSEDVGAVAQEPTGTRGHGVMTPSAQGAVTSRGHGDQKAAAKVSAGVAGGFAARRGKVQLRADQETWLHGLVADAIREGVRVSEGDVLRLALDRLRAGKAEWAELREAILAEIQQRSRRR